MEIVKYPDPRLQTTNAKVGRWTPEISAKVDEMFQAMEKVRGVGLAAPQVGWNVRLFVMSIEDKEGGKAKSTVVFDPTIEVSGPEEWMPEGCLSFPHIFGKIKRRTHARLIGMTPNGPIDENLDGLAAQAVQHEMDHLDGILFIERMTPAELKLAEPALKELRDQWRKNGGKP